MATFGHYEADRALHRTGFSTIYLAPSAEQKGSSRVIKAYKPSVRMHDKALEALQRQAFLDSAGVQQQAARLDPTCWAPIHEFGTASSGPFYVTDQYDFSLRQLIDGHVKLGAAGLHNIIGSIARGLLALQQACSRPHGNLKLTNILIAGRGDVAKAAVVLCDPLPDCPPHSDPHARADLWHLGEIIHELVMHRGPSRVPGYQAPDAAAWQMLGKHGPAWRQVCNRLLQADVEPEPISLDELVTKLAALRVRRSRRAPLFAVCISAAVVCALLYYLLGPGEPPDGTTMPPPENEPQRNWYEDRWKEADGLVSKSPQLDAWGKSYVRELLGDKDDFLKTYRTSEELDGLKKKMYQRRVEFNQFANDFHNIETDLNACCMLDDKPAETGGSAEDTLGTLYEKWKSHPICAKIAGDEACPPILQDVNDRVQTLEVIRRESETGRLLQKAQESRYLEARYAAWRRLDAGVPPLTAPQWEQEQSVQKRLKEDLDALERNRRLAPGRLAEFNALCQTREGAYLNIQLNHLVASVEKQAHGVALLQNIGQVRPPGNAPPEIPRECESTLQSLVASLASNDWFTQYDLTEFRKDHPKYFADIYTFSLEDVKGWLNALPQYKSIGAPWTKEEYDRAREDFSTLQQRLQGSANSQPALRDVNDAFKKTVLPPIEKNRNGLGDAWAAIQDGLKGLKQIESSHPPECLYLTTSQDNKLEFSSNAGLAAFVPIRQDKSPFMVQSLDKIREDKDIEAAYAGQPLGPENPLWPKYIGARQDPNVILRLVPGEQGGTRTPFYIAAREITNAQYSTFLKKRSSTDRFAVLIKCLYRTQNPYPSFIDEQTYGVTEPNKAADPVAWVTYGGAQRYADWIEEGAARLPTPGEHRRAAEWAAERGNCTNYLDPNYYHIRTEYVKKECEAYNLNMNRVPPPRRPGGAIFEEPPSNQPLTIADDTYKPAGRFRSAYPLDTSAATSSMEIRDLVGNVWEWCTGDDEKPRICGGSCRSPAAYARPDSSERVAADTSDCDLGFRIVVPCPPASRTAVPPSSPP